MNIEDDQSEHEACDLYLVTQTDKAYLLRDADGDEQWIPKSQVKSIQFGANIEKDDETLIQVKCLVIPTWLAEEKGYV